MVKMYKSTICEIHNTEQDKPMTVDLLRYNLKQTVTLSNGLVISKTSEPVLKNILIFTPAGSSYVPAKNDKVVVIIDDNNFVFCLPIDMNLKPKTTSYNPIYGNFKTNSTLKFNEEDINISNKGNLNVLNNITNIQSSTSILLGENANKPVAYVGCKVDLVPNSPTYGQIIEGSTTVMVKGNE